ncbi:hypothetical protein ACFRK4_16265, partial [Peribacillus butanolivorans]
KTACDFSSIVYLVKKTAPPIVRCCLTIGVQFRKGSFFISIEKAVNAGLSFRPLEDSVYDVYQWEKARQDTERKTGISREREQELLEAWFQKEKKETL